MLGSYQLIECCCIDNIVMSRSHSSTIHGSQRNVSLISGISADLDSLYTCHPPRSEFSPWSNMYDSIMEIAYRSTNGALAVTASIED